MRKDEELVAPNDWGVVVKSISEMSSYDNFEDNFLRIIGTDDSGKSFQVYVSSPTLQAAAWAAYNAFKSDASVKLTLRVSDGSDELYWITLQ
ncbi:hypothetical protein [Pseudomonas soli]|uniref:hypothetical protein n=1 Tax=Pseudomonas soli TaxID=1306993 RepID=UPI0037F2B94B